MAARFGPAGHWPLQAPPPSHGHWHQRWPPSMPPWGEAAPRPPPSVTEYPPYPYGSPAAAARPPPMYPHVARLPSPVPQPRPAGDGEQRQEGESSGATERPILRGDVERCQSPNKGTPPEGALVPDAANAGAVTMPSTSLAEEVAPGDPVGVGGEPKHDVEDGHGVQPLHESREHSSEQMTAEVTNTTKDRKDEAVARLCQDSPADQENGTSSEQKQTGFVEPTPQAEETSARVKGMLTAATSSIGGEPKHDVVDGHGVQPLYGSGEQSSEQRTAESTMKDWRDELVARLCHYSPAGQENGASSEQMQIVFREPTPQAEETFSGVKRKLTVATSPVAKKQKPVDYLNCDLCQRRRMTSMHDLVRHWAGKKHLSKLQARIKTAEAAMPGSPPMMCRNGDKSLAENGRGGVGAPRPAEEEREPASSRWTCNICDLKCNSASNLQDHLGGRRHREKMEAILAKFKSCYSRKGKNTYCCKICDAHCNSDTMLASHLIGRRHRKTTLQGRD